MGVWMNSTSLLILAMLSERRALAFAISLDADAKEEDGGDVVSNMELRGFVSFCVGSVGDCPEGDWSVA